MFLVTRSVEQYEPPTLDELNAKLNAASTAVELATSCLDVPGMRRSSKKVLVDIAQRSPPIDHFEEYGSAITARQRLISIKASDSLG
jgi:hypothetical protein